MLFPTLTFAVFFTLVFSFAWVLRCRNDRRKLFLLAASYVFYGWWDWRFCFLLASASFVAWGAGRLIGDSADKKFQKQVLAAAVTLLLGVLGFFKYYGFFLNSLQEILFAMGLQRDLPFLQIILPVGISFFTFQAISYVVDVYRGAVTYRKNPLDVLLYISFFPQLVAGPIVRAADFLPQLEQESRLTRSAVTTGLTLCLFGLFKKMVVANYLATDLVDPVFLDPGSWSSLMVVLATYGYAIQIYCDFSGYSDIAIGTAALLGFQFKANFNQPYRATSLQDFWRRWHMSLSQWLRDYLYIPLGGSKGGTLKTYRNLFLTMFLGGLWHGAAWNFVIWGSLHGAWLGLERMLGVGKNSNALRQFIGWIITFHIVCAAWIFFRASDLDTALAMFAQLSELTASLDGLTWFTLALIALPLAFHFVRSDLTEWLSTRFADVNLSLAAFVFALGLLITLWLAPAGTAPFIYFQF